MAAAVASKVALVTGANKGIGYRIVRQLSQADSNMRVLLGARDMQKGEEAAKSINAANVQPIEIDIDRSESIAAAAKEVQKSYGGLDLLVCNAGIAFKGNAFDTNVVDTTFHTNYYGTLSCIRAFTPLLREGGRIVNTSSASSISALGKMSASNRARFFDPKLTIDGLTALLQEFRNDVDAGKHAERGWPESAYGMSKVGVTFLTRILAKDPQYTQRNITVNCCCPGWCRTDMAGDRATRSAEEGAATITYVCLLPAEDRTTGAFSHMQRQQQKRQEKREQNDRAKEKEKEKDTVDEEQKSEAEGRRGMQNFDDWHAARAPAEGEEEVDERGVLSADTSNGGEDRTNAAHVHRILEMYAPAAGVADWARSSEIR